MQSWIEHALELLKKSLQPVRQELNRLDWKLDLSTKDNKIHCHLSAFSNTAGGGFLVFGVDKNGPRLGGVFGQDDPDSVHTGIKNNLKIAILSSSPTRFEELLGHQSFSVTDILQRLD